MEARKAASARIGGLLNCQPSAPAIGWNCGPISKRVLRSWPHHPANRGSMTKVIEAVRQLRGEAHPAVQVKNCDLALAQGTGFQLATRHGSATLIMERE